jgi:hypothetical protein
MCFARYSRPGVDCTAVFLQEPDAGKTQADDTAGDPNFQVSKEEDEAAGADAGLEEAGQWQLLAHGACVWIAHKPGDIALHFELASVRRIAVAIQQCRQQSTWRRHCDE